MNNLHNILIARDKEECSRLDIKNIVNCLKLWTQLIWLRIEFIGAFCENVMNCTLLKL
jgi:hypothetical protein